MPNSGVLLAPISAQAVDVRMNCKAREFSITEVSKLSQCNLEGWTLVTEEGSTIVIPERGMVVECHRLWLWKQRS